MTKKKSPDMSQQIMKRISDNEIKMHSKVYFNILNLALIATTGLFIILLSLLTLLIIRDVQYGTKLQLLDYDSTGRTEFLQTIPWLAIVFGLLSLIITITLVKRFEFSYKHRLRVIIGIILFVISGLILIFSATGIEKSYSKLAPFYELRTFNKYLEDHVVSGVVVESTSIKFEIRKPDGQNLEIIFVDPAADIYERFITDETVTLFGDYISEKFEAFGIRNGSPPKSYLSN